MPCSADCWIAVNEVRGACLHLETVPRRNSMVPRRRRLCLLVLCIYVLDATSPQDVTSLGNDAGWRLSPEHTARWRHDTDQSKLTPREQGVEAPRTLRTTSGLPAAPSCGQHSCPSSTDSRNDPFLNDAIANSEVLNGGSQRHDGSVTSWRAMPVKSAAQAPDKELRSGDRIAAMNSLGGTFHSGLSQPRQSRYQLPSVRRVRTIQV